MDAMNRYPGARPVTAGVDFIPCGMLYKAMGGYECHGGRYNKAQDVLARNGWAYLINTDGWLAPERQRGA